jgi:spermidine synthase
MPAAGRRIPLRRHRLLRRLVLLALPGFAAATPAMQLVHSERSLYRQVLVYEDAGLRYLCFTRNCNIGRQSGMDVAHPQRLVFDYTRMMMAALFLVPEPKDVLVIGLGGGSLPRALAGVVPRARIDVVEIDPAVVRVAQRYFRFAPAANLPVYEEDGRAYVRRALRAGRKYDLIMLDAYDHEYIPEHLLTQEFLREVRGLLRAGGVVAANTFSASRLYHSESVTYRSVFGEFYNLKGRNRVILACNGTLPPLATIRQNSAGFAAAFSAMGFSAAALLQRFSTKVDWDPRARVLTDQYSPANLLNSAR